MLEFLSGITLFGAAWTFWACVIFLIGVFFYSEHERNGFIATFFTAVFIGSFWYGGSGIIILGINYPFLAGYLIVGIVFSMIRTFVDGAKFAKEISKTEPDSRNYIKTRRPSLKNNVFRWISLWPISLIYWAVTDLMFDIFSGIWMYVEKIYIAIDKWGQSFYTQSDEYLEENKNA